MAAFMQRAAGQIARRGVLPLLILGWLAAPARAQEFCALGGILQDASGGNSSSAWQLEYRQGLGEHFAFGISYLNEGHVPSHHRDGNSAALWARTSLFDRKLSLEAGAGPYFFYDTTKAEAGASFSDDHGWGAIFSLAATWYTDHRWFFQLRNNWVETFTSIDTFSTLVGIGYQLDPPPAPGAIADPEPQPATTTRNELTFFAGQTIVNSFDSQHSTALSLEYRRGLWRYLDWTVAWLHEGDNRLIRRNGIASQLWLVRAFLADRLALGFGGGAYFAIDRYSQSAESQRHDTEEAAAIVTMTGSYRLAPHWDLRTSWNRIVTNYDRDTDVILGGIGYRF